MPNSWLLVAQSSCNGTRSVTWMAHTQRMTLVALVAGIWTVLIILMLAMLLALLRAGRHADWLAFDIPPGTVERRLLARPNDIA